MNTDTRDKTTKTLTSQSPACCDTVVLSTCCGQGSKPDCCGPQVAPVVCGCGADAQGPSTDRSE